MVLPNGIIAGVNKAGTTAVFHALAQQRNVVVSNVKETHFFNPLEFGEPLPQLSEYEAFFTAQPGASAVIEGTPSYFYGREPLAKGIDAAIPGVRVLVILREPGARAYSLWRFSRSRLRIDQDLSFRDYLEKCLELGDRPQKERGLTGWRALSGGLYSQYLPAWQNTFGSRLLIAFYDDIRSDFEGAMERICAHFGVERIPDAKLLKEHNVTTDVRSVGLQKLALKLNNAAEELWRKAPILKAGLRNCYYKLNARGVQQTGMSLEDRHWLDEYFHDDLERLRVLTEKVPGRPAWLAPRLPTPELLRAAVA